MTAQRWAALQARRLGTARRAGIVEWRYPATAREQVDELVAGEARCCPHLHWEARSQGAELVVKIRGTDDDLDAFD